MYHCTVPTDSLLDLEITLMKQLILDLISNKNAVYLGKEIRQILENKGFKSVASHNNKAPSVIVSYCNGNMIERFKDNNIQVAGYVPFKLDEPKDLITFRVGLFGIDKLKNPEASIKLFRNLDLKN